MIAAIEDTRVSLRDFCQTLVSELEKRCDDKFKSAEQGVKDALIASDKLNNAAFIAAKDALKEAAAQLAEYKASSNEWRETLTDLIAKGMLRPEVEALVRSVVEKIDGISTRVSELEVNRGNVRGHSKGIGDFLGWVVAGVSIVYGIVMTVAIFWHLGTK